MNIQIVSGLTPKIKRDFLSIPKIIYDDRDCPQDLDTEKAILEGKHAISKDITVMPFVIYDYGKPKARCLVTFYENDDKAYLGYYECDNDINLSNIMLTEVEKYVKSNHKTDIVGPIDASFWIGYRFRLMENQNEAYNRHFTGEPYHKEYYPEFWKSYGFEILDTYKSNFYRHVRKSDICGKYKKRMDTGVYDEITVRSSSKETFESDLEIIYEQIVSLYKTFPMYKDITIDQFKRLFNHYKDLLDLDMVKLAFKDSKIVGFVICFPNYGTNTLGRLGITKFVHYLTMKDNIDEYVVMYCGVDPAHYGIGLLLSEIIKSELISKGCSSIGALIKQGKVTGAYYKELTTDTVEYITLSKKVDTKDEI